MAEARTPRTGGPSTKFSALPHFIGEEIGPIERFQAQSTRLGC